MTKSKPELFPKRLRYQMLAHNALHALQDDSLAVEKEKGALKNLQLLFQRATNGRRLIRDLSLIDNAVELVDDFAIVLKAMSAMAELREPKQDEMTDDIIGSALVRFEKIAGCLAESVHVSDADKTLLISFCNALRTVLLHDG